MGTQYPVRVRFPREDLAVLELLREDRGGDSLDRAARDLARRGVPRIAVDCAALAEVDADLARALSDAAGVVLGRAVLAVFNLSAPSRRACMEAGLAPALVTESGEDAALDMLSALNIDGLNALPEDTLDLVLGLGATPPPLPEKETGGSRRRPHIVNEDNGDAPVVDPDTLELVMGEESVELPYVAADVSRNFHKPDCPRLEGYETAHLVGFRDFDEAVLSMRAPCPACMPGSEHPEPPALPPSKEERASTPRISPLPENIEEVIAREHTGSADVDRDIDSEHGFSRALPDEAEEEEDEDIDPSEETAVFEPLSERFQHDGRTIGPFEGYRIEEFAGEGYPGLLLACSERESGKPVMVRYLEHQQYPGLLGEEVVRIELGAAALDHPGLLRPLGHVRTPGGLGLVSAPPPRLTLFDRLAAGDCLEPGEASRVFRGMLEALAFLHAQGEMHLRLRPDVVHLEGDVVLLGEVIVESAFGHLLETRYLPPGMLVWRAPEQLDGGPATPATDIYQAGLVLYRAVTGRLPFETGITPAGVRKAILAGPTLPPHQARPGLPQALDMFLQHLVCRDPRRRIPTAAAALGTLNRVEGLWT